MGNRSILVVDDDPDIRTVLQILLEQSGYKFLSASDGEDALRLLRAVNPVPCLIILDLRMPGMNGWQFREVQARDQMLSAIPVVVISADGAALARSDLTWARALIPKPFTIEKVMDVIDQYGNAA